MMPTSARSPAAALAVVMGLSVAVAGCTTSDGPPGPMGSVQADAAVEPAGQATSAAGQQEVLADTEAYLATIEPLAREADQLIETAIEPAVSRLGQSAADTTPPPAGPSDDVTTSLHELYDRWILAEPPRSLEESHALFAVALDRYVAIAERLAEAGTPSELPAALHDELVAAGTEADELYDRGARLVQQHLTAHGGQPVAWLPHAGDP